MNPATRSLPQVSEIWDVIFDKADVVCVDPIDSVTRVEFENCAGSPRGPLQDPLAVSKWVENPTNVISKLRGPYNLGGNVTVCPNLLQSGVERIISQDKLALRRLPHVPRSGRPGVSVRTIQVHVLEESTDELVLGHDGFNLGIIGKCREVEASLHIWNGHRPVGLVRLPDRLENAARWKENKVVEF